MGTGTKGTKSSSDVTVDAALRSFGRAFKLEVGKLELLRTMAWQGLGAVIAGCGAVVVVVDTDRRTGITPLLLGSVYLAWFSMVRLTLVRGTWRPILGWGSMVLELTAPWLFVGGLAIAGMSPMVVSGWGPVLVFCGAQTLGMLKLNPRYPVFMGAVGALQYILVMLLVVNPAFDVFGYEHPSSFSLATRALYLLCGSLVWAYVTNGLRGAMGGIVSTVRQKDLFGKYRLEKELAAGGMGVVWLATYCPEGGFERPAAIKLVHPHLASDTAFVDAFRREAELGARLVHSHIVQVFDFGCVEDRYFLAMEYVDGVTLRDVITRAAAAKMKIPPPVAGAVARGLLAGLGFAHAGARGADGVPLRVIHRDLAPSNILIDRGGSVKVTDFGIARALRDRASEQTETVAGHFDHMAPEQGAAAPLDERTDLFCVGILLWEMLTGQSLFRRTNEAATLLAVALSPIPAPSTVDAELTPWNALCARALAREPNERFTTADEMSDAISVVGGEAGEEVIARFIAALPSVSAAVISAPSGNGDVTTVDPKRPTA